MHRLTSLVVEKVLCSTKPRELIVLSATGLYRRRHSVWLKSIGYVDHSDTSLVRLEESKKARKKTNPLLPVIGRLNTGFGATSVSTKVDLHRNERGSQKLMINFNEDVDKEVHCLMPVIDSAERDE